MKKLLSLLLVLAMTISLAVPAMAASDFTDVSESHPYYTAIQSLVARGIISGMGDGTFAPDANIKRSEFAKMVILSIGMGNVGTTVDSTGFPDVATDHWAAGFIKAAHGQGIINGYDDGTFKPDENVTYEQAIAMVIRAKSVFLKAEAEKIGYPDGYIQIATKYHFVRGINDGVKGEPAKRATIAKLMDNSIKAELPKDIGGIPTLEDDNEMEEIKGQLMAIKGTSLLSGDTDTLNTYQFKLLTSGNQVTIFDAKNLTNKNSLRSYLGKKVIVYYEMDEGNNIQTASSLTEQRASNYEQEISLSEIYDYSSDFVSYDDGTEEVEVYIASEPIILYNGVLTSENLETLIKENEFNTGSIRFLSTSGEGDAADVIFFTAYTNLLVTATDRNLKTIKGEILDDNGTVVNKSYSDIDEKKVVITKDGNQVGFDSIKKDQILSVSSVSVSGGEKVMEILISDKTVSGKVMGKDDINNTIRINSKDYTFITGLKASNVNMNANLKLYLDSFGKVARYKEEAQKANYTYGYLLTATSRGTMDNTEVGMSILKLNTTSTTSPAQLQLADQVTINNKPYKIAASAGEIISMLKENAKLYDIDDNAAYAFGDEVFQPIRYSTGSDGKINNLYLGVPEAEASEADLKVKSFIDGVKCTVAGSSPTFQNIYKLSSTMVVYVPDSDAERRESSNYIIRKGANAGFTQGEVYKALMIDVSAASAPAILVVYKSKDNVATTEWEDIKPVVVTAKGMVTGDYPYSITVTSYSDANPITYYDEGGSFYSKVNIGDVVRISAATDYKIEELEVSAEATEIYKGNEYIKPIEYLTKTVRNVTTNGADKNDTYSRHNEGNPSNTPAVTLYAGAALEINDGWMKIGLSYPVDDVLWTEDTLSENNLLENKNISGAKILSVEFKKDGTVKEVVETESNWITTYKDATGGAETVDKMVVYCYGDNARLVVLYRAAK